MSSPGCKSLVDGEKLIFQGTFYGVQEGPAPIELSQKVSPQPGPSFSARTERLLSARDGQTRLRARLADAAVEGETGVPLVNVGTHDLRRTLATGLGNMGVADEVIERVLNHAPRSVAGKHYNHAKHFEPMRRALEAWADRVREIVDGREAASNVVALRTGTNAQ